MLSTNVDFLRNKVNQLEKIIFEHNADFIFLNEINSKTINLEGWQPVIKGYTFCADYSGRGVALFHKSEINVHRKCELENLFHPSIFCEVGLGDEQILFGTIYRSPNASLMENADLLNCMNSFFECKKADVKILVGDFNYGNLINWEDETCSCGPEQPAALFLKTVLDNFVTQTVREPTHHRGLQKANILDLVLTSDESKINNMTLLAPVGKSHHSVIIFDIIAQVETVEQKSKGKFYLMNRGDYKSMREELKERDWIDMFENKPVDQCWKLFTDELLHLQNKFIPAKEFFIGSKPCKKKVPFTVLEKIRNKREAFKCYKKFRTKENYNVYAGARNQVKWALRRAEIDKELNLAQNIKSRPKAFYNYVSSKTKPKEHVQNIKTISGMTKNDKEKADALNTFFVSVFTREDVDNLPDFQDRTNDILSKVLITESDLKYRLSSLKVDKSSGPDNVHPKILKELSGEIAMPLKLIFEKSLDEGKLPKEWKIAEVKPIFKKGDRHAPGNYRPVSLTSVVCKVMEGIIRDTLNSHLIDKNLISNAQYGFTKGRSCTTQLLSTFFDWMTNLDNGIPTDAIYLDLQKAFDTVPHKRLLLKLQGYGIRGNIWLWIKDFLKERLQYVKVGNSTSNTAQVTSGVPQGSVLGPTLFVYYINDMAEIIDCLIKIFADDTKLYHAVDTSESAIKLQENINRLTVWANDWQLKFNENKCKVLHLGKNNNHYDYTMNGTKLEETRAEKDLGVYVDPDVSFEAHINETVKKANRITGMIVGNITCKKNEVMVPLFKSLVRPILEYGNAVWNNTLRKQINRIEDVQRRFTKKICGMKNISYEERLESLRLPSLEFRQSRGDLIEMYKLTHNIYDIKTTKSLFHISTQTNTRGHPYKVIKRHTNTKKYSSFFANRIVSLWNDLPEDIVCARTINTFKNRLDKHFKSTMYKTELNLWLELS